jgi:hypothetical protein
VRLPELAGLTGGPARRNIASWTRVPIGGAKEQMVAAASAGITIIPRRSCNQKILRDRAVVACEQVRSFCCGDGRIKGVPIGRLRSRNQPAR